MRRAPAAGMCRRGRSGSRRSRPFEAGEPGQDSVSGRRRSRPGRPRATWRRQSRRLRCSAHGLRRPADGGHRAHPGGHAVLEGPLPPGRRPDRPADIGVRSGRGDRVHPYGLRDGEVGAAARSSWPPPSSWPAVSSSLRPTLTRGSSSAASSRAWAPGRACPWAQLITHLVKPRFRHRAFGLFGAGTGLGTVGTLLVMPSIAAVGGYRAVFVAAAVLAVALAGERWRSRR